MSAGASGALYAGFATLGLPVYQEAPVGRQACDVSICLKPSASSGGSPPSSSLHISWNPPLLGELSDKQHYLLTAYYRTGIGKELAWVELGGGSFRRKVSIRVDMAYPMHMLQWRNLSTGLCLQVDPGRDFVNEKFKYDVQLKSESLTKVITKATHWLCALWLEAHCFKSDVVVIRFSISYVNIF